MEVEVDKTNQENKSMEPATKTVSKRFMFKVSCQETMEKAENDKEKFERKFKLSSDILVEKIESKFDVKEKDVQTLIINISKDVKVTQVPIAMDE